MEGELVCVCVCGGVVSKRAEGQVAFPVASANLWLAQGDFRAKAQSGRGRKL